MRYTPTIAYLWATASGATVVISWQEAAANAMQLLTLALTGLGGAFILLYQKKLTVDRENRDICRASSLAEDLAKKADNELIADRATWTALEHVHSQIVSLIAQGDQIAQRNDQLFAQVGHLAVIVEKISCRFPTATGEARCTNLEKPPCLE